MIQSRLKGVQNTKDQWPEDELQFVKNELTEECFNVSITLITMAVELEKEQLRPEEGRDKLIEACRRKLTR